MGALDCYARSDASMEAVVKKFSKEIDLVIEDKVATLSWGGNHLALKKMTAGITNRLLHKKDKAEGAYIVKTFTPRIRRGFISNAFPGHWEKNKRILVSPHWGWYWRW